jgi:hypothetical protein
VSCGFVDDKGEFHQREDCHHAKYIAATNRARGYVYIPNAESLGLVAMKFVTPKAGNFFNERAGRRVRPMGTSQTSDPPAFQQIPAPPSINLGSGIFPIVALLGLLFLLTKGKF